MEAETRSAEARERIRLEQLEAERRQQRGRRRWTDLGQAISSTTEPSCSPRRSIGGSGRRPSAPTATPSRQRSP
jgi:hypothetical protein